MLTDDRRWLLVLFACSIACTPPKSGDEGADDEADTTASDDATATDDTTGGDPGPWDLYAEAECAAYADCGCSDPMGLAADLEACIATRRQALATIAEQGALEWDPTCAQARLDLIATSCGLGQAECAGQQCSLFVGSADAAAACSVVGDPLGRADAAECMAGLACRSGACGGYDCNPVSCEAGGGWCPPGSQCFCVDLGPCSCAGDSNEGGGCDDNYGPGCVAGLVCDSENGICSMPGQLDQACVAGVCVPGAYCDFDTFTCVAQSQPGDPCVDPWECLSGACDGTCSDLAQEGEPCGPPTCAEGLSCMYVETLGINHCLSSKQPGEACEAAGQCQGGTTCVAGICQSGLCSGL